MAPLKEGIDYYINPDGLFVFTEAYHIKRGYCCKSGCLHCPYGFNKQQETTGATSSANDIHPDFT